MVVVVILVHPLGALFASAVNRVDAVAIARALRADADCSYNSE